MHTQLTVVYFFYLREDTESSITRNPSSNKTIVFDNPSPKVERKEVEPYNPPTPPPQRSILKDSNLQNVTELMSFFLEGKGGVIFN